ncbi:hypothetical protein [Emticicia sp. 17c]|uniref:hypothetical protein n=1 Tax=Emticicia sp. 17c TaxID=3127704 RepID=UPI00301C9546
MKTVRLILALSLLSVNSINAQTLNWASLQKQHRHIANINIGLEYGVTVGITYGYQLKTSLPVVIAAEYSMPSGKTISDDFKTKIGGQIRWVRVNDFNLSTRIQGVFRRFENNYVTLANFGTDVSGVIGYYKPKWFLAGETGFDKAIVTHFKHTELMNENFAAKNGWYVPATGGNFYYGMQAGFSWRSHDLSLKVGKVISQDFRTKPLLPFYAQIGYSLKMK